MTCCLLLEAILGYCLASFGCFSMSWVTWHFLKVFSTERLLNQNMLGFPLLGTFMGIFVHFGIWFPFIIKRSNLFIRIFVLSFLPEKVSISNSSHNWCWTGWNKNVNICKCKCVYLWAGWFISVYIFSKLWKCQLLYLHN